MKKLIFLSLLIYFFIYSHSEAQIKFGITSSLNLSNVHQQFGDDAKLDTKILFGYGVGALVRIKLIESIDLETGLKFKQIGNAIDIESNLTPGQTIDGYSRIKLSYLSIPVVFSYKLQNLRVIAGAYCGIGLGGEGKYDFTMESGGGRLTEKGRQPVKFGYVESLRYLGRKRLDLGAKVGMSYALSGFEIVAVYDYGLRNTHPGIDEFDEKVDTDIYNRVFVFSVNYFFGD